MRSCWAGTAAITSTKAPGPSCSWFTEILPGRSTGANWCGHGAIAIGWWPSIWWAADFRTSRPQTEYSYRLSQRVADVRQLVETLDLTRHYAGGARLGRRNRHGRGGGGAGAIHAVRVDEYGGVPRAELSLADSPVPYPGVGPGGRAGAEPVRSGRAADRPSASPSESRPP